MEVQRRGGNKKEEEERRQGRPKLQGVTCMLVWGQVVRGEREPGGSPTTYRLGAVTQIAVCLVYDYLRNFVIFRFSRLPSLAESWHGALAAAGTNG